MGRKNGKTSLVAPIALYALLAEGEGAEVYSCAADRAQAKLILAAAKRTVELDPELSRATKLYRDAIECPETGSIYRALSSEAYTKEGLSPTLVLADELHAWPNRDLYDVMSLAMGARVDPLMLIVTTAGVRTDTSGGESTAFGLYQYGQRLAAGTTKEPSFYFAWWQSPDDTPVDDPAGWKAANPGLGDILDRAEIRSKARLALAGGVLESEFRTKRLNGFVAGHQAWLPAGLWEARAVARRLEPQEEIVLAFDGSYSNDSSGLVACTLDGYIETIAAWEKPADDPTWRVPIEEVIATIHAACRDYRVLELAMDPFRWAREAQSLANDDLPVQEYPTNSPARMIPACAKFMDALIAATTPQPLRPEAGEEPEPIRISHDGDPRLARHLTNAVLKIDQKGPRIVKDHTGSARKIDLAVCAVVAYDRATWHAGQADPGPYFSRID